MGWKAKLLVATALAVGAVLVPTRRGRYRLQREQVVAAPVEDVFRFFADPRNLSTITPPWVRFEVLDLEAEPLRAGITNQYRIRWLGLPLRWSSLIVEHEPGRRFVDLQTRGPYRYWRHEHAFEDAGASTLVRDVVEYEMRLGPLGRLVHGLLVARQLREIFDYRGEAIGRAFQTC